MFTVALTAQTLYTVLQVILAVHSVWFTKRLTLHNHQAQHYAEVPYLDCAPHLHTCPPYCRTFPNTSGMTTMAITDSAAVATHEDEEIKCEQTYH